MSKLSNTFIAKYKMYLLIFYKRNKYITMLHVASTYMFVFILGIQQFKPSPGWNKDTSDWQQQEQ